MKTLAQQEDEQEALRLLLPRRELRELRPWTRTRRTSTVEAYTSETYVEFRVWHLHLKTDILCSV